MNKRLLQEQEEVSRKIQNSGYNVVTCGHCGDVLLHEIGITELPCAYCEWTSDISDFPDLVYEGMADNLVPSGAHIFEKVEMK